MPLLLAGTAACWRCCLLAPLGTEDELAEFREIFNLVDRVSDMHACKSVRQSVSQSVRQAGSQAGFLPTAPHPSHVPIRIIQDGGGTITKEELGELMDTLGIDATPEEIDLMINEIDQDNNGEIDFSGKHRSATATRP